MLSHTEQGVSHLSRQPEELTQLLSLQPGPACSQALLGAAKTPQPGQSPVSWGWGPRTEGAIRPHHGAERAVLWLHKTEGKGEACGLGCTGRTSWGTRQAGEG